MAQQSKSGLGRLFVEISRSHTIRHTQTPGSTAMDKRSAHLSGRYLHKTQNKKHRKRICMPSAGFKPAIPAIKPPQVVGTDTDWHGH